MKDDDAVLSTASPASLQQGPLNSSTELIDTPVLATTLQKKSNDGGDSYDSASVADSLASNDVVGTESSEINCETGDSTPISEASNLHNDESVPTQTNDSGMSINK